MSDKPTYENLSERLNNVNRQTDKYNTLLEENEKRLSAIKEKAKEEYDVETIEELRALVVELQKKEKEELEVAAKKIENAEIILKEIQEDLAALES